MLLSDNKILDEGNAMTYNQHSTAQHSTAQHSTAQHSTAQHSTAQHSTAQHAVDNNRLFLLAPKRSGPLERFFRPLTLRAEGQVKIKKS
ncbi:adenine methyltransferase [Lactococcus garvieae subsp. garvieae]|nr:adenine methyltransferase [Lactococcus garvieae subsp. garvieae]QPR49560.1 adenine methyltransferase [Lactococcus garvieae]